jgi:hypothetical protein
MPLNEIERYVGNPREWQPDRPTHNWFEDKPTVVWEDEYQTAHTNVVVVDGIRYRDSLPSNVHLRFWYQYHGVVTIAAHYAATAESQAPQHDPRQLESQFRELLAKWRTEIRHVSSLRKIVMNQHYQAIIGMGKDVLPFIFRELRDSGGHWYWALHSITRATVGNPDDTGLRIREAWLKWGEQHDYLKD